MRKQETFTFTVLFKVKDGDVYEIPVVSTSFKRALNRSLKFFGFTRDEIILCVAGWNDNI